MLKYCIILLTLSLIRSEINCPEDQTIQWCMDFDSGKESMICNSQLICPLSLPLQCPSNSRLSINSSKRMSAYTCLGEYDKIENEPSCAKNYTLVLFLNEFKQKFYRCRKKTLLNVKMDLSTFDKGNELCPQGFRLDLITLESKKVYICSINTACDTKSCTVIDRPRPMSAFDVADKTKTNNLVDDNKFNSKETNKSNNNENDKNQKSKVETLTKTAIATVTNVVTVDKPNTVTTTAIATATVTNVVTVSKPDPQPLPSTNNKPPIKPISSIDPSKGGTREIRFPIDTSKITNIKENSYSDDIFEGLTETVITPIKEVSVADPLPKPIEPVVIPPNPIQLPPKPVVQPNPIQPPPKPIAQPNPIQPPPKPVVQPNPVQPPPKPVQPPPNKPTRTPQEINYLLQQGIDIVDIEKTISEGCPLGYRLRVYSNMKNIAYFYCQKMKLNNKVGFYDMNPNIDRCPNGYTITTCNGNFETEFENYYLCLKDKPCPKYNYSISNKPGYRCFVNQLLIHYKDAFEVNRYYCLDRDKMNLLTNSDGPKLEDGVTLKCLNGYKLRSLVNPDKSNYFYCQKSNEYDISIKKSIFDLNPQLDACPMMFNFLQCDLFNRSFYYCSLGHRCPRVHVNFNFIPSNFVRVLSKQVTNVYF